MSSTPYQLTNEQFEFFVSCCQKYIAQFGLIDWDITFVKDAGLETRLAQCQISPVSKAATIFVACDWGKWPISRAELEAAAYHEVLELLLSQIQYAMMSYMGIKEITDGLKAAIDEAVHRCIATFTNVYVRRGADVLEGDGTTLSLYKGTGVPEGTLPLIIS